MIGGISSVAKAAEMVLKGLGMKEFEIRVFEAARRVEIVIATQRGQATMTLGDETRMLLMPDGQPSGKFVEKVASKIKEIGLEVDEDDWESFELPPRVANGIVAGSFSCGPEGDRQLSRTLHEAYLNLARLAGEETPMGGLTETDLLKLTMRMLRKRIEEMVKI